MPAVRPRDIAQVYEQAGREVQALFRFVRDRIRYDPYHGVLRGARGTLLAGAGNAMDQAVLLHTLLTGAGHQARFVQGRLDRTSCEALLDEAVAYKPANPPVPSGASVGAEGPLTAFAADVDRNRRVIEGAFRAVGAVPPLPKVATREERLKLAAEHAWVQVRQGTNWLDLDPSFPLQPGEVRGTQPRPSYTLPEDLWHRVTVEVLVGPPGSTGGGRVVLHREVRSADIAGQALVLTHRDATWEKPTPAGMVASVLAGTFGAASGDASGKVRPVLIEEGRYTRGEEYTPARAAGSVPPPAASSNPFLALGGLGIGGAAHAPAEPGERAWLRLVIHSPGRPPVTVERDLELPPTGPGGAPGPKRTTHAIAVAPGPLTTLDAAKAEVSPETEGRAPAGWLLKPLALSPLVLTDALLTPATVKGRDVRFVVDAPRVVIASVASGQDGASFVLDLAHLPGEPIVAGPDLDPAFGGELQRLRGAIEGAAEDAVLRALLPQPWPTPAPWGPAMESATATLRTAEAAKVRIAVLKPGVVPGWMGTQDQGRVAAEQAAGHVVIAPEKPVGGSSAAWWRVDGSTGHAVAVSAAGRHSAAMERVEIEETSPGMFQVMVRLTDGKVQHFAANTKSLLELMRAAIESRAAIVLYSGGQAYYIGGGGIDFFLR